MALDSAEGLGCEDNARELAEIRGIARHLLYGERNRREKGRIVSKPGRPKEHLQDRVTTAVRIPKDLYKKLKHTAIDRDTSVNHLIVRASERYLEQLPPLI